ncbi:carbohydrate ABC transporter permease [Streptomyces sp. TRM 70361]|uniref:carbohydrate ABC transporter permease n=1 Tax=Streptomyces sp. TRM 70361 TaxID=3116553 RepID=UPI002E7AFD2A|nr:carbohydrate ABC transporter permease [Streptomyces sp. TRM 70361]MEE1942916.1 carbohydrate ABC transporter permease [Streptomyces sp. TRM 70361]
MSAAVAERPAPASPPSPARRRTGRRRLLGLLKHVLLTGLALTMIYPLIWLVVSSFRPGETIFRDPALSLQGLTLENYGNGWTALGSPFSAYLWNSALLVFGTIVGNLFSCSLAAYAFARLRFRGRRTLFAIMLGTIMLPIHVLIVPQYVLFSELHMLNTFLPLVLPKFLATDAFFVFLMVQFIRSLPRELDEAARIDGAGHPRIFLQVILPLMVPALATTAIFTFIGTWNDFFGQLIYLTREENWTAPLALRTFLDAQSVSNYGGMFAMSVVSLLPLFLMFLVGQRWLLRGIATTGIK